MSPTLWTEQTHWRGVAVLALLAVAGGLLLGRPPAVALGTAALAIALTGLLHLHGGHHER